VRRALTEVIACALIAAACGTSGDPAALIGIDEDQLAAAEEYFAGLDSEANAFEGLQDSNIDDQAIRGFLEAHYSPDIVFDDATFGDHSEGYDEVAAMYRTFLFYFADATASHQPTLVGDPTALIVIPFSGMTLGQWQVTADDPLVEVDLQRWTVTGSHR